MSKKRKKSMPTAPPKQEKKMVIDMTRVELTKGERNMVNSGLLWTRFARLECIYRKSGTAKLWCRFNYLKEVMKQYRALVTDEALNDMESIYEYIANELLAPDMAGKADS